MGRAAAHLAGMITGLVSGPQAGSVRSRLFRLAVLLLLPGLAISVLLTWRTFVTARRGAETALRETARGLDQLVDREFIQAETLLRTLAATDELRSGRMPDFDRLARDTVVMGGAIVLIDPEGRELIDTALPAGAPLPPGPPPAGWAVETVGRPVIYPLATGAGDLRVRIVLPVGIGGHHVYDLMLIVPTGSMQTILARESLPAGWIASIMDTSRQIVARTADASRFVGHPAGPVVQAALSDSDEGVRDGVTADGMHVVLAFSRSRHSRWTVAVASPEQLIAQAGEQSASLLFGLGSAAILSGLFGAMRAARGISRPIEALAVSAQALGEHESWVPIPPGLEEADAVARAMAAAAARLIERRDALSDLNATLSLRVPARTHELAEANHALEEERGRLGQILDDMPVGVLVHRVDGAVVFVNPEAKRLLGLPMQGDPDAAPWPVIRFGGVVLAPDELPFARARAGITTERMLLTADLAPGRTIELEVNASPLRDPGGRIVLSVTTLQDVTARLEAEEARRRSQRLEAVGQLTGGVAHEFNNLLMAISGCLDLLSPYVAGEGEGRAALLLANATRATARGGRLTRQLLAFSRQQNLQIVAVDLNRLVQGLTELLEGTLGGSVRVVTLLDPAAWPALADPAQLELVLLNLAINARDAMPGGGQLTIRTANDRTGMPLRAEDPPEGEHAVLEVSDTGQGMEPAVLARAFEPFFTTKDVGRGSGLGLPQVLGVAQQLGGGVIIASQPGQGTTVRLFLPRARTAADHPLPRPAPSSLATGSLQNVRLLLVDDDADVREVARAMLEEMGAAVIEADSAAAALLALRTSGVDVVLADLAMPGMTGIELASEIAALLPALPVILMTGYGETALGDPGPHIRLILQKPFRSEALAQAVAGQIGLVADQPVVAGD